MGVKIIFELGATFRNFEEAVKLTEYALSFDCDVIKYQLCCARTLINQDQEIEWVDRKGQKAHGSVYYIVKQRELIADQWRFLIGLCGKNGRNVMMTIEECGHVTDLAVWGVPMVKISSSDIDYIPLLRAVRTGDFKQVHLDTGSAELHEIERAVCILSKPGTDVVLHHCPRKYNSNDAELGFIEQLKKISSHIAFSDHSDRSDLAIMAVAAGANAVEKVISLPGINPIPPYAPEFDFAMSDHSEIGKFTAAVRQASRAMIFQTNRIPTLANRRSAYALYKILPGDKLTYNNVQYRRPRTTSDGGMDLINRTCTVKIPEGAEIVPWIK